MSKLVAIAYPDLGTAEAARSSVHGLATEHAITLQDIVIVEHRSGGKIKLHQAVNTTGAGAAGGALWGGLIGLLFLAPLVGAAIGAASGAAAGAVSDVGVDDKFMKSLGEKLEPGSAALFVLYAEATADKVLPVIAEHGGGVLQTSLDDDAEQTLRDALARHDPAAAAD